MDKKRDKIIQIAIYEILKNEIKNLSDLDLIKRKIAKKYNISTPSNVELLKAYHKIPLSKEKERKSSSANFLIKKSIRSLSGVAVISVLTKEYPCPGKCIYCPTEKGMPKSYLSNEPAVMRAILNKFDPYKQVASRIKALELAGHKTDKIELIMIGGTWSCLPLNYKKWFVKRCFEACNKYKKRESIEAAQKRNEKAKHRIVGITAETRPDFINKKEIINLRDLGVTRVELGVQSIYDDVLSLNKRGHKREEIIKATRLLKESGFKICYHMMPNLFGSSKKRDKEMFKEIFENPDFCPDLLKIYPCAIIKGTPLYIKWKRGKYHPYKEKDLINTLKDIKKTIPLYCRIQRLVRDIPSQSIVIGPAKISNLRQIIKKELKKEKKRCRCIRCREVGKDYDPKEKLYLFRKDYDSSNGKEIFLSYESKNQEKLYSLLRLRIQKESSVFKSLKDSAIIREVHTYGKLLSLVEDSFPISPQHKGLGKKLIKEAEKIALEEFGIKKIAVISGVGVRSYYRKLGFKLRETYMIKNLAISRNSN